MSYIYFPGCKYTALAPQTSAKIKDHLQEKMKISVTGCCRIHHKLLTDQDTALVVCPTCYFNLQESAPQAQVMSIWELLAEQEDFPWPDYQGKSITVQDCIDTRENPKWQQAVRTILNRMNLKIIEIEKSFDQADFCNIETSASPEPKEKQMEQLLDHCNQYTTESVLCYCTGCFNSLKIGGVHGIHLMDLIIGEK